MNKPMRQIAVALACAIAYLSPAAAAPIPAALRFDAAFRQALNNRAELAIEREKIRGAHGKVAELDAAFLPAVSLTSTNQNVHRYDVFSGITAAATFAGNPVSVDVAASSPRYQTSLALELNYNLYKGGGDQARVHEALQAERAAVAQYSVIARQVLREVAEACSSLMKAALTYRQSMRALALAQLETTRLKARLATGAESSIDTKEVEIRQQARQFEVKNALRALRETRRKYCTATGATCAATDGESDAPEVNPDLPNVKQLYAEFNLTADAELAKAAADSAASGLRIRQARADYRPTIDLFAHYSGIGRSERGFSDVGGNFGRELSSVGIKLSWVLFEGFKTDSRVKQESAIAEQLRLKQSLIQRDSDAAHLTARDEAQALEEQMTLEKLQLELARDKERIAAKRLHLKLISGLEHARIAYALAEAGHRVDLLSVDLAASKLKEALQ